ncbi:MAG: division/cell wall cluster transcriptional repressor MraZ [Alphaproteobacteria bacterium]|nr:MAG: division/cell wall cluster transcriptional repressor MraZ [Alphaproteobacteria bacterium]
MGLFLSTFINRVDKKGRVSVPAPFRAALAHESYQGVVLFPSYTQKALEGVGMAAMENMGARMDSQFAFFSDDHDELATVLFGESVQLNFDENGRIILPQNFIDFAGIDDQVAFVGLGQKFQIWTPKEFESRKNIARNSVTSKKVTLPKGVES